MKCAIVASGKMPNTDETARRIRSCDLVICADGGTRHFKAMNLLPHVIIGDFDSTEPKDRRYFEKKGVKIVSFPTAKDKTDSQLSVEYAVKKKATEILMFGFTGSRMDHTLANVLLLKNLAERDIQARIIDANNEIFMVTSSLSLNSRPGDYVSLIPISKKVTGITLEGFLYPLQNAAIEQGSSLGISNQFKDEDAVIKIDEGFLLVTISKD